MAEREGFEPPEVLPQRFSRPPLSTTQPSLEWRRHSDSNRGIKALQAHALPLGYVALILVVPKTGLEPVRTMSEGF